MEWENLVAAGVSLLVLFVVYKFLMKRIERKLNRKEIPPEARNGIVLVIRLFVLLAAVMIALWGAGVDTSSLYVLGGIAALTISFASQTTLGNFVAGIYLILAKPFRPGDYIRVGTAGTIEGVVKQITLNYTKLQTIDKIYFSISNQQILNKEILNYRFEEGKTVLYRYPIELDFHISLTVERINKIFSGVIEGYEEKFPKSPEYYPLRFDDSSVKFVFVIYVKDPKEIFTLKPQMVGELLRAQERAKSQNQ